MYSYISLVWAKLADKKRKKFMLLSSLCTYMFASLCCDKNQVKALILISEYFSKTVVALFSKNVSLVTSDVSTARNSVTSYFIWPNVVMSYVMNVADSSV